MKRAVKMLLIAVGLLLLFPYHGNVDARKNPYKDILPPSRLNKTVEQVEAVVPPEPAPPELFLVINIAARKLTLFDEGREVARYSIAVGQPIYKTPAGPQSITSIVWNPWWLPPDSPWAKGAEKDPPGPKNTLGPVKMLMGQGIRLHGTNKDSSVGSWASHGCLRMHNKEAIDLAWYIQKRINKADDSLLAKYRKNQRTSFYVTLETPLEAEIIYEPVVYRKDVLHIYPDAYRWGKDIKSSVIEVLFNNGVDLKKIDAEKIAALKYPKNRNEVTIISVGELLSDSPRKVKASYIVAFDE